MGTNLQARFLHEMLVKVQLMVSAQGLCFAAWAEHVSILYVCILKVCNSSL